MATQWALPSGLNSWVPRFDVSGMLVAGYSRNVDSFALNRYSETRPVSKPTGYYDSFYSRQFLRVRENNIQDFVWAPGQPRPSGTENSEYFTNNYFEANRYDFPITLDQQAVDLADWNQLSAHMQIIACQAMLARTIIAQGLLTNTSWGTHTASATTASASVTTPGKWNTGTDTNAVILASLNYGWNLIAQDTGGAVKPNQTCLVAPVSLATVMASSAEIHAYVRSSPFAQAALRGDSPSLNAGFGMPDMLYGARFCVEDTYQDTNQKYYNATTTDSPVGVQSSTVAYLLSRPGALVGIEGSPSWSTLIGLFHEEMQAETFSDTKNRLVEAHIVDYYTYVIPANVGQYSAFAYSSCQ